jgi:hypothetical protein
MPHSLSELVLPLPDLNDLFPDAASLSDRPKRRTSSKIHIDTAASLGCSDNFDLVVDNLPYNAPLDLAVLRWRERALQLISNNPLLPRAVDFRSRRMAARRICRIAFDRLNWPTSSLLHRHLLHFATVGSRLQLALCASGSPSLKMEGFARSLYAIITHT